MSDELATVIRSLAIGWAVGTVLGLVFLVIGIKLKWFDRFFDWLFK